MQNGPRPGSFEMLDAGSRRELMVHALKALPVQVKKGRSVSTLRETPGHVYLVQEGRLNVVLYSADGRQVSLRDLTKGQLFGELSAMDNQAPSVNVVAATDATLLRIAPDVFRRVILAKPESADWLIRRLITQVRGLTDRVFELSVLNVRTRLHCELLRLARSHAASSEAALTHADLATRIGTHREAVTRELAVLAERNIVATEHKKVRFLDVAGLEEVVAASLRAPVGDAGTW